MREIDLETWPRRKHFEVFSGFDYPHFSLCANVDVTLLVASARESGVPFTVAVMYLLTRAANSIPEFRQRIRDGRVIEHEVVHPSGTILVKNDLFSFCTIEYSTDLPAFADRAARRIAEVKEELTLEDDPGQDNLLFMSAIPWVSFTSFNHPIHMSPADSVPRLAWGKRFADASRHAEQDRQLMPLSVQGHHALMDGLHMGKFYARVQELFDRPLSAFGDS